MKKLLVILLLLFPVHGAWAKIVHLQCTDNQNSRNTFVIDLEKKTFTNSHGLRLRNVSITSDLFHAEAPLSTIMSLNKELEEEGKTIRAKKMVYIIYRSDGYYISRSYWSNGETFESTGYCKDITKKKF